jgi:hypothetical protein
MICPRCRGLMVPIRLEDVESSSLCFSGWQCLLCGEVTDHGIAANRDGHHEPRPNRARPQGSLTAADRKRRGQ